MKRTSALREIFTEPKPIIGMVHVKALPGSPLYDPVTMSMERIVDLAVREARLLEESGVDGVQVENIWDYPYMKSANIGMETIASLAVVASKVKDAVTIPIGINVHLNGGQQALAIACSVGARWIRVFEWVNVYVSHAGFIAGAQTSIPCLEEVRKVLGNRK